MPHHRPWLVVWILMMVCLLFATVIPTALTEAPSAPQDVIQAWENARRCGSYAFATEMTQTTLPAPTLSNAGAPAKEETLHIVGEVDLNRDRLSMTLFQDGPLGDRDEVEILFEDGQTYGHVSGQSSWQAIPDVNMSFAPGNDSLAFLAAATNIKCLGQESRTLANDVELTLVRYSFALDGPAFAGYLRTQLEESLREKGKLPSGIHLDTSDVYRTMTGSGEVWIDQDDLPVRLIVVGQMPPLPSGERQRFTIQTDLSNYDRTRIQTVADSAIAKHVSSAAAAVGLPDSAEGWRDLSGHTIAILSIVVLLVLFSYLIQHSKLAYHIIILLIILSSVATPLLESLRTAQFMSWWNDRVPSVVEAASAPTDADLDGSADSTDALTTSPLGRMPSLSRSPASAGTATSTKCANESLDDGDGDGLSAKQECELGTSDSDDDSDDDGLSDGAEVRLGTDPKNVDTDRDGIHDAQEVNSFDLGQKWYSNPVDPDTNQDGLIDGLEAPERTNGNTGAGSDTDGDGVPDIWDDDNDGDGVLDAVDLSPNKSIGSQATPFKRNAPFKFTASGLTKDKPILVDLQLRPTNEEHLAHTLSVFDWPTNDVNGNVHETHNKTFGDFATDEQKAASPSLSQGDVRLVPMIELIMDIDALPLVDAEATYSFDEDGIKGDITLKQDGSGIAVTADIPSGDDYSLAIFGSGPCGSVNPADALAIAKIRLADLGSTPNQTINGQSLTDLANSKHTIYLYQGSNAACLTMADLPNGGRPGVMVGTTSTEPYGVALRDTGLVNEISAYVPANLVYEPGGGRRAAFSARMAFQPDDPGKWDRTTDIRLVWLVQMLRPSGSTQTIHTYYDEWILAGMSVREDHGVQIAIVHENPSGDDDPTLDNRLLALANSLEQTFVAGRQEITVAEIKRRFDAATNGAVSKEQRWGLPQNAFRVHTYNYPTEDHVAKIMMGVSSSILEDQFGSSDTPTLLYAIENMACQANLDARQSSRDASVKALTYSEKDAVLTANLSNVSETTIGSMSWAPYRYQSGQWESFPIQEYWDHLDLRLSKKFPIDPNDVAQSEANRATVMANKLYYLSLSTGIAGMRKVGVETPTKWEGGFEPDEDLLDTWDGRIGDSGDAFGYIAEKVVEVWAAPLDQVNPADQPGDVSKLAKKPSTAQQRLRRVAQAIDGALPDLEMRYGHRWWAGQLGTGRVIATAASGLGAVIYGQAGGPSDGYVAAVAATIATVDATMDAIVSIREFARGCLAVTKSAKVAGAVGLVITGLVCFGQFTAQMIISKTSFGALGFNDALASTVATVIVAAVMLALSFAVPIGTIVAAVIGAIDAAIAGACAWVDADKGEDKDGKNWSETNHAAKRLCGGIGGLLAAFVKIAIYSKRPLVGNLQSPNRLKTSNLVVDLVERDHGFVVKADATVKLDVRNQIVRNTMLKSDNDCFATDKDGNCVGEWEMAKENDTIPLPFDPLALPYFFQILDDGNTKKAAFKFSLAEGEVKSAHGSISFGDTKWKSDKDDKTKDGRQYYYIEYENISKTYELKETGINRPINAYLVEAYAVPWQECALIPSPVGPVPVCWVRAEKKTNNLPLSGALQYDVFPETLSEFVELSSIKNSAGTVTGWAQAWGQSGDLTFPALRDADNDGLAFVADSNDGQWDQDGDRLSDHFEAGAGTQAGSADTDGDGLSDDIEVRGRSRGTAADSDGDGLSDGDEVYHAVSAGRWEGGWEIVYEFKDEKQSRTWVFSDPLNANGDGDAFTDVQEKAFGLSPYAKDTGTLMDYQVRLWEEKAPQLLLRFEENVGATAFADHSGEDHGAACAAGACPDVMVSGGRYGNGARFSEHSTPLRVEGIEMTGSFSVAFWAKRPAAINQTVLDSSTFSIGFHESTGMYLGFSGGSLTAPAPTDGQWHHYACVYDAQDGNRRTIYVDGASVGTDTPSGGPAGSGPLHIGAASDGRYPFQGTLDEFAIYPYALSARERQKVMEGRYDPQDMMVSNQTSLKYDAQVTNNLLGRYAQGLLLVESPQYTVSGSHTNDFELAPQQGTQFDGSFTLDGTAIEGTVDLAASASIVDRREQSGMGELWLPLNEKPQQGQTVVTRFRDFGGVEPPREGRCSGSGCPRTSKHDKGISGNAVYFDGVDDVITVGQTRATELTLGEGSFSISFWAQRWDDGKHMVALAQGRAENNKGLALGFGANDAFFADFHGNRIETATTHDYDWHHYVLTYNRTTGKRTLYVDGENRAEDTTTFPYQGSGVFYLGRSYDDHAFKGKLDEVRVFGRELSASEASELTNIPTLHYSFDAYDADHDFEDLAGDNWGDCEDWWIQSPCAGLADGIKNNAVEFTGHEYFGTKHPVDLTSGRFSISAWVYPRKPSSIMGYTINTGRQGILGTHELLPDGATLMNDHSGEDPIHGAEKMVGIERIGNKLSFGIGTLNRDDWYTTENDVLTSDAWNHVVLTFDKSASPTTRIYVGGRQVASSSKFAGQAPSEAVRLDIGRSNAFFQIRLGHLKVHDEADDMGKGEALIVIRDTDDTSDYWDKSVEKWKWHKQSLEDGDNPDVPNPSGYWERAYLTVYEDDVPEKSYQAQDDKGIEISMHAYEKAYSSSQKKRGDALFELDYELVNPSTPLKGRLDELAIYGRPLSAADVSALYRAAESSGYLPLDEPPASLAFRDGTISAASSAGTVRQSVATAQEATAPVSGVSGRSGRAVAFTGSDQFIDWTKVGGIDSTLSFWLQANGQNSGRIISRGTGTAAQHIEWGANGSLCVPSPAGSQCSSVTGLADGAWHHVVQSVDRADISHAIPSSIQGRYVRIQKEPGNFLALAEVEIKNSQDVNIAAKGRASQSSTNKGGQALRAIDGVTTGAFAAGSVSLTHEDTSPWWEVDLGERVDIDEIILWERTDSTEGELRDFYVFVSDTPFSPGAETQTLVNTPGIVHWHIAGVLGGTEQIVRSNGGEAFRDARYVRVQPKDKGALALAEVQVQSRGAINLAQGKEDVGQSSTFSTPHDPGKPAPTSAVDGNTDGTYTNGSVSRTATDSHPSWWQVDLDSQSDVERILVYPCTDPAELELDHPYLFVSAEPIIGDTPDDAKRAGAWYAHYDGRLDWGGAWTVMGVDCSRSLGVSRALPNDQAKVAVSRQVLYVDGAEVLRSNALIPVSGQIRLGKGFEGRIDEVRIHKGDRPISEVLVDAERSPKAMLHLDGNLINEAGEPVFTCVDGNCPGLGTVGQVGLGAAFDGTNDAIRADWTDASIPAFAAWVLRGDTGREQWLLGGRWGAGYWSAGFTADNRFGVRRYWYDFSPGGTHKYRYQDDMTKQSYPDENWNHWAYLDGKIYRNGQPAEMITQGGGPVPISDWIPGDEVRVGRGSRTGDGLFRGVLDELYLWTPDTARQPTPTELRELYRAEVSILSERKTYPVKMDRGLGADWVGLPTYVKNQPVSLGVTAARDGRFARRVDIKWQKAGDTTWTTVTAPPCQDAGAAAWCPTFEPSGEGMYELETNTYSQTGLMVRGGARKIYVDSGVPTVSLDWAENALVEADADPNNARSYRLAIRGSASDPQLAGGSDGSGVRRMSVVVRDAAGNTLIAGARDATLNGTRWSVDYPLELDEAQGAIDIAATATDGVGNETTVWRRVHLDTLAPYVTADVASLDRHDRTYITRTATLQGAVDGHEPPGGALVYLSLDEASGATSFNNNYALGRAASQSTTTAGDVATRAVDGDANTDATTQQGSQPWWQVDLAQVERIDRIVLDLEQAGGDMRLYLSSVPFTSTVPAEVESTKVWRAKPGDLGVGEHTLSSSEFSQPGGRSDTPRQGRYLRVQLGGEGTLAMGEVRVLSKEGTCSGSGCPDGGQPGVIEGAARFDGSNDTLQMADVDLSSSSFTIAFWAQRDDRDAKRRGLVSRGLGSDLGVLFADATTLEVLLGGETLEVPVKDNGNWHHYALSYDRAADTLDIYVDGARAAQRSIADADGGTGTLWIAPRYGTGGVTLLHPFKGQLDEFIVLSRALSSQEIRAIGSRHEGATTSVEVALVHQNFGPAAHGDIAPDGQILYLAMDDMPQKDGQLVLVDGSGNGRKGTCYGNECPETAMEGVVGSAMAFDGSYDDVSVWNVFLNDRSYAVSFWAQRDASRLDKTNWVVGQGIGSHYRYGDYGLRFGFQNRDTFGFHHSHNWTETVLTATVPADSDWHHYVATYDRTTNLQKIFVDGVEVSSGTANGPFDLSRQSLDLGKPGDWWEGFKGLLDEVRVFDRAISPDTVSEVYHHGRPVLWLQMDEEAVYDGDVLPDHSRYGHTATVTTQDETNKRIAGQTGLHGLSLDGKDDQVLVSGHDVLKTPRVTVALWVRVPNGQGTNKTLIGISHEWDGWRIELDADGTAKFETPSLGTGLTEYGTTPVNDGAWHHIAAVYNGAQKSLYVDGMLEGSPLNTSGSLFMANTDLKLGLLGFTDGTAPMGVDDVRVYDYGLNAETIRHLADSGWHATTLSSTAGGHKTWQTTMPAGLEGNYALDLRATDAHGNTRLVTGAWQGLIDTWAPRLELASQIAGGSARYTTKASDGFLVEKGYSTPVGAGVIDTRTYDESALFKSMGNTGKRLIGIETSREASSSGWIEKGTLSLHEAGLLAVSGNRLYVSTGEYPRDYIVHAIDISDLSNPREVGSHKGYNTGYITSLAVGASSDVVFVTYERSGPAVLNFADPSNVQARCAHDWCGGPKGWEMSAATHGSHVYVGASDGLWVYDISNADDPSQIGRWTGAALKQLAVTPSGQAVVAVDSTGTLRLFDVSTPSSPSPRGTCFATYSGAKGIVVSSTGQHAYIADDSWDVQVIDIGDLANPTRRSSVRTTHRSGDVALGASDTLFMAGYAGMLAFDLGDPANPTLASTLKMAAANNTTVSTVISSGSTNTLYTTNCTVGGNPGVSILTYAKAGPPQSTACDQAGNCTTKAFGPAQTASPEVNVSAAGLAADPPVVDGHLDDVPYVLSVSAPITLTGKAYAENDIMAVSMSLDGTPFYSDIQLGGGVTETEILSQLTASGEGSHELELDVSDWIGNVFSSTGTLILDTLPPQVSLATSVFTSTHLSLSGMLVLTGTVADTGGLLDLVVNIEDESLAIEPSALIGAYPPITQSEWSAFWPQVVDNPRDDTLVPVIITVTDVAYRQVTETVTVEVDLLAPREVTPTVTVDGSAIEAEDVLTDTPVLTLHWPDGYDDGGISSFLAGWHVEGVATSSTMHNYGDGAGSVDLTGTEGTVAIGRLVAEDNLGNHTSFDMGPYYVDGPYTPDYIDPVGAWDGWLASECALMGTDTRARDQAVASADLEAAQRFYTRWNSDTLQLVWTGADWDLDGELFVHLDTRPGGSPRAYDPWESDSTLILLPASGGNGGLVSHSGRAAHSGPKATSDTGPRAVPMERWAQSASKASLASDTSDDFGADYVIWISDNSSAQLLVWNESGSTWDWTADLEFFFGVNSEGENQTELQLPMNILGITDPATTPVGLVAVAAEDDVSWPEGVAELRLWATMPANNPVSSERLLETTLVGDINLFSLVHAYHWDNLGDSICPNGVRRDAPVSSTAYTERSLGLRLDATPASISYRFLGDGVFETMRDMPFFADSAAWQDALDELCASNPDAPSCLREPGEKLVSLALADSHSKEIAKEDRIPGVPGTRGELALDAWSQAEVADGQTWDAVDALYQRQGVDVPPVGDGDMVTYVFDLTNNGSSTLQGLAVDMQTFGPLRLPKGTASSDAYGEYYLLTENVGDLAPGASHQVAVQGVVDYTFDQGNLPEGHIDLHVVIYDMHGSPETNQIEWATFSHLLDQEAPTTVIETDSLLAGIGENLLRGIAYDASPIRHIDVEIEYPDGSVDRSVCADDVQDDGSWVCIWQSGVALDGDTVRLRARGTDVYDQTGEWTPWVVLTIDAVPPMLTLGAVTQQNLEDNLIGPFEDILSGGATDDHLVELVRVCRETDGTEFCETTTLVMDPSTLVTTTYLYNDLPDTPLPLGSGQACDGGSEIRRVFSVTDTFDVADLVVGLRVEHPFRYDVSAWLESPSGTSIALLWDAVPNTANYDVLLSDGAAFAAADDHESHVLGNAWYEYTLRPAESLGAFEGEPAEGDWILTLCDDYASEDDGAYLGAQLRFAATSLPIDTAGGWSYAVLFPGAVDHVGPETFTFTGLDSLGNRTTEPRVESFYLDNVPPEIGIQRLSRTEHYVTVTDGSDIAAVYADAIIERGHYYALDLVPRNGRWWLDTASLGVGPFQVLVTAIDAAGNTSRVGPVWVNEPTSFQVSKSDWVDPLPAGWHQRYTLMVTNVLNIPLTNLVISDTLPPQTYPIMENTSLAPTYDETRGEVIWEIDELASGDILELELALGTLSSIPGGNVITNTLWVAADDLPFVTAEAGTTMIGATPHLPLTVSKVDTIDPLVAGEVQRYIIQVTNPSEVGRTHVVVSDTIPALTEPVLDESSPGAVYDAARGEVVWILAEIAASSTLQLELALDTDAAIEGGTVLRNQVWVMSGGDSAVATGADTTMLPAVPTPTPTVGPSPTAGPSPSPTPTVEMSSYLHLPLVLRNNTVEMSHPTGSSVPSGRSEGIDKRRQDK